MEPYKRFFTEEDDQTLFEEGLVKNIKKAVKDVGKNIGFTVHAMKYNPKLQSLDAKIKKLRQVNKSISDKGEKKSDSDKNTFRKNRAEIKKLKKEYDDLSKKWWDYRRKQSKKEEK